MNEFDLERDYDLGKDPLEQDFKTAVADQEAAQDSLFHLPNVVGVGIGRKNDDENGDVCVSVFVSQKLPKKLLQPSERVDTAYDVVDTGDLFALGQQTGQTAPRKKAARPSRLSAPTLEVNGAALLNDPWTTEPEEDLLEGVADAQFLTQRVRPAKGGYSVGHSRVTAGTIATGVYDAQFFPGIPQRYYILSNNHVLANSNNARIGDPILQPGRADGGRVPQDVIGHLSNFVPLRFGGPPNFVDAAIAEVPFHDIDRQIYWIGHARGVRMIRRVGEYVQKTGRTTNYTTGRVTHLNATVNVNYGGGRVARMVKQIVTTNMSAGGDSGSCVLDMQGNAIGLLFAGSSRATILNQMLYVQAFLRIKIV